MSLDAPSPPAFTAAEAQRLAAALYGVDAVARPLPGYDDQNFLLIPAGGPARVLKISRAAEERRVLDFQNRALDHLAGAGLPWRLPRPCPSRRGRRIESARSAGGRRHRVRLLTYVDGVPWAEAPSHHPALLHAIGRLAATVDRALDGFAHPAMRRISDWDLMRFPAVERYKAAIVEPARRRIVERIGRRFARFVAPRRRQLPAQVVHNDVNNHNVLLDDSGAVTGLIDFGDLLHTATVCEVAIAVAYFMLDAPRPLAAGGRVLRGYHAVRPLAPVELEVLFDLVLARLAMSVTFSAFRHRREPHNAYLIANRSAGWRLLEELIELPRDDAAAQLAAARG